MGNTGIQVSSVQRVAPEESSCSAKPFIGNGGRRDDRGVNPALEDSQSSGSGKGQGRGVSGLGFVFYFRGKVAIFITKG